MVKSIRVQMSTAANAFTSGVFAPAATLPFATQQAIVNVLKLYPAPDVPNAASSTGIATEQANQAATEHYGLGRVDYNVSDKDSIFFRAVTDKVAYTDPFGGGGF